MDLIEQLKLLKKIFVLQDLQDDELKQVLAVTQERYFEQETIIMQEGDPGDVMYIICEGEVAITKRLILEIDEDAPKEKVMTRLRSEQGVVFGEMALIENDVRSATVSTLTPCRMLELNRSNFYELIVQHLTMGVKILLCLIQLVSSRLRKSSEDVVKLTTALAIALDR